ncbi:hypothetical protein HG530_007615 [Fusarium avenaceum]|nr:hypothetical protein DER45DRAFT_545829 [Fusarium avenaceum]KAI6763826.1 hypothetical protein HG530_007615 [Fusarium avenaceum]
MGLPLFIAPVESDLPSKAAEKSSATSPPRSSIRRYSRPDLRRASQRRLVSLRDRLASGSAQESISLTSRDGRPLPWAEVGFPPDAETTRGSDGLRRPRPFRDVLSEMTRSDDRRREQLEEQINSLFRDGSSSQVRVTWNTSPDEQQQRRAHSRGAFEPPRLTRTALARPPVSRTSYQMDEVLSRRSHPIVHQPSIHRPLSEGEEANQPQSLPWPESQRPIYHDPSNGRRQRFIPPQRSRGVDGLGDRDRSLSPEVWDTLLSTLTPDPQPPSVGSSFASNVASQNTAATSSTSFTAPDLAQDTTLDQACESGCEGSDTEAPTRPIMERIQRRRDEMRRVRVRVPTFSIATLVSDDGEQDGGAVGFDSRHQRSPDGPVMRGDGNTDPDRASRHRQIRDRFRRSSAAWVGHLSVGNSDDEQGPERIRPNEEGSATPGNNTHTGDEEWLGMLRIVRNLARREDIPDEWWAEAGLSRTLPGDGTE